MNFRIKSNRGTSIELHVVIKIFLLICFTLITVALIICRNSPAIGYEISIYSFTPVFFWGCLFLSMFTGILISIWYLYFKNESINSLLIAPLLLIYLCYSTCVSLYIIRGYYMWCMDGDPASHIGYINQILSTGYIPNDLFYPVLHIYGSQFFLISNIDMITLHKIIPLIFGILYVPFIYLFSKSIFSEDNKIILSTIVGSTFVNGWYLNFTPNCLSNLFFPLLLYILIKIITVQSVQWEILTLIMAFFYPIFHPVPTLALLIIILSPFLPNYISNRLNTNKIIKDGKKNFSRFKQTLVLLIFTWSLTWISSFYIWDFTIANIYTLINEGGPSNISTLVDQINYASGYGYNVIELALKKMGGPLVYILITVLSFPIIYKNKEKLNNLFSLYYPFLFICLFMVIIYFLNFNFGPLRILTYTTIISVPFVTYLLNYLIDKMKTESKRIFTLSFVGSIFLLFIVLISGILTLYPSPYVLEASSQTTQSDIEGMNWFFKNQNLELEITTLNIVPFRFADLLLSPEQQKLHKIHEWVSPDYLKIPFHFGYDNNSILSSHFDRSLYMGIGDKDKRIYEDIFPEMAKIRWTPDDFEKLEEDISTDKIYSSKSFELFYVNGAGK